MNSKIIKTLINEEIDAIALPLSPWHAIGVDATLLKLSRDSKKKVNSIILLHPHPISGNLIDEKSFSSKEFSNNIYIEISKKPEFFRIVGSYIKDKFLLFKGLFNLKNNEKNKRMYIICPLKPNISVIKYFANLNVSRKYYPYFIIIDEGIAPLVSETLKNLEAKDIYNRGFAKKIFFFVLYNLEKLLENIVLRNIDWEYRFILDRSYEFPISNNVSNSYLEIIKKRNELRNKNCDKTVVFVTQPFSELKKMSKKDELRILGDLIKLFKIKNFSIILKTHPREHDDKYNIFKDQIHIIQDNRIAEDVFYSFNPSFVIGFSSTSLINAQILFNITSISVIDLINPSNSEYISCMDKEFKEIGKRFIRFVKDYNELNGLID